MEVFVIPSVTTFLCPRQSRDESIHDDDIENNQRQIKNGGDQCDWMELMCHQLMVKELNERLHGRYIEVLDVIRVVDRCQQLDSSGLLILLADMLQKNVKSHRLNLDRFKTVVFLVMLVEL